MNKHGHTPTAPRTPEPPVSIYVGLFLIAMSMLLLELGLTRIFSVVVYHHMAFFAISVTMFGLAFGGVIVHFFSGFFTVETTAARMHVASLGFAASTIFAMALLLAIPFDVTRNRVLMVQMLAVAVALAIPFTCGGIAIAVGLTRYPRRTNLLYGWDLAGAAAGCLLFAPLLWLLGGPRFILMTSFFLSVAAVILAIQSRRPGKVFATLIISMAVLALGIFGNRLLLFQVRHVRGGVADPSTLAWEGWNAISRITVGHEEQGHAEGIAPAFYESGLTTQHTLLIDSLAATPILKFDGTHFDQFYYPRHDVSYVAHALRPGSRVAVIGVGGGRDIIAAKAWGQPEVVGIEINGRIIQALTQVFSEYAGRPLSWPGFTLINDEARSYLTRGEEPFDIIQASLIDTFAATAAGAFVMSENSLYTLEGWRVFLNRLSLRGILTMTRWYTEGNPVESVRLLVLARAALEDFGVERPQDHIMMLRTPIPVNPNAQPLATIVVSKSAFSPGDVARFTEWANQNGMLLLVTPEAIADPELRAILETGRLDDFVAQYPFEVSAPTDDRPFFFDVLRWRDIFSPEFRQGSNYIYSINLKPIVMLGTLLMTVIMLGFAFIVVPLAMENRRRGEWSRYPLAGRLGMLTYFVMLGLGYMLTELSLIQRLTLFLGHPGYSLSVCLFTMLLASGLGSMAAARFFQMPDWLVSIGRLRMLTALIFVLLLITMIVAEMCIEAFIGLPTWARIGLSCALIFPAAFFMGMPFALGLQLAARRAGAPLAWFWGINGAFSVCASVLTVALAHSVGLRGAYLAGAACYLMACFAVSGFRPEGDEPKEIVPAIAATE